MVGDSNPSEEMKMETHTGRYMDKQQKIDAATGEAEDRRIKGTVTGVHLKGYIWVQGADDKAYFGHVSKILHGVQLTDIREGDSCTFIPGSTDKGPAALAIEFDFDNES